MGKIDTALNQLAESRSGSNITFEARKYAQTALKVLHGIVKSPRAHTPSRVKAAQIILERAYGKAPQLIVQAAAYSDVQLEQMAQKVMEKRQYRQLVEAKMTRCAPPLYSDLAQTAKMPKMAKMAKTSKASSKAKVAKAKKVNSNAKSGK